MAKERLFRDYKGRDAVMLAACETVLNSAVAHKDYLISKRSQWADPFFQDRLARIQNAYLTHLGIDNARGLREATRAVMTVQDDAIKTLAEFKVQIKIDFKKDKTQLNELLRTLGYIDFQKKAENGDQVALTQFLFQFKDNMTPETKAAIMAKGTDEQTIDKIIAFAERLRELNVTQEGIKGSKKEITKAAVVEFNAIYNEAVGIARIAYNFYKHDRTAQSLFSFVSVMKTMNQPTNVKEG